MVWMGSPHTSDAIKAFAEVARAAGVTGAVAGAAFRKMADALNGVPAPKKHPLVLAVERATEGNKPGGK